MRTTPPRPAAGGSWARRPRTAVGSSLLGFAVAVGGCGGVTPPPDADPSPDDNGSASRIATTVPTALVVESEVGALDRGAVQDAFAAATPELQRCLNEGRKKRQPLIGGSIEPVLRIDTSGHVLWSYLRESTLGDYATETCILEVLGTRQWPRPSGGKEGETSQQMDLGDPDEREPVAWTAEELGPGLDRALAKARECQKRAGTGPAFVTLFVDPTADGRAGTVVNAGVAVSDEKGPSIAECVVRALLRTRVRSPGSYTARVTLRLD